MEVCYGSLQAMLEYWYIERGILWKGYSRENITKATKGWENVAQTRLGGEFRACYVIAHKTYSKL